MGIRLSFVLFFLLISQAYAGLIAIPLEDKDHKLAPASDLIYQGNRINEVEALELESSGVDLSLINPYDSDLFQASANSQEPVILPPKEVNFHSVLQSPTEFFRFASKKDQQSYTVTASLFNHETVLRSHILRKIGYRSPLISYQPDLKVNFESAAAMDLFIQKLVESTLLAKKKWVIEENRTENFLKLRGLILESSDTKSVPVYWPIMEETRQRKRRVFRSLLYLYTLTDFNMPINEISWTLGKKFNNELILSHHFAEDFSSVTYADIKWIHRRVAALSAQELCSGLMGNYPADIGDLLCEKIKSRINSMGKVLGLNAPLKINESTGSGQVRKGKLTSGDYPDYVPTFWIEDIESPYRFSEIFKFFRTQVAYDTVSSLLNTAEKAYLPGVSKNDAHDKILDKIRKFGRKTGSVPLKVWSTPIIGGAVGGSRSIVFGKYDGNDAPIQLVDSLNMKLNVGLYSYLTIPGSPVSPTVILNAQVVRSWRHIKAMPDLTTATKQKVEELLVPKLYKSLGALLQNKITCSLQDDAWTVEEIVAGLGVWVVYYNQSNESAKESAIKLREELIAGGTPKNKIFLRPVLRDELCLKEITEKRNKSVEEFLKSFAADETLSVTDSFETTAGLGAKISDGIIDGAKLQAGLEGGQAVLRTYIIRKTETGIEITIRNQRDLSARFFQEANFFLTLMSNSTNWLKGDLHSKVYQVNFDEADDEQKKIAIDVLREIFLRSSYGLLNENYNPITMDHDANVRLNTFKFLWRKSERLGMNHEVSVVVPNRETVRVIPTVDTVDEWTIPPQPTPELSEKKRTRNLFSSMNMFRRGSNYHTFLNNILTDQVSWLGTGAQDGDPGQSIKGKSFHTYVVTEGDLTEGYEFNPVTKIEYGNVGWSIGGKNLESMLQYHEYYLSTPENPLVIDRSIFNQTELVRSYNIRTTIILYPTATEKILNSLLVTDENESISLLRTLYGAQEWDRFCKRAEADSSSASDASFYESTKKKGHFICVPSYLMGIMDMRKNGIAVKKQDLAIQINSIVQTLVANADNGQLLSWLGKENYFGNSFISGFRNGDALGYLMYGSDSVGTYNKDLGTGVFDQIAALLGVKAYNLKGMVYTPNM